MSRAHSIRFPDPLERSLARVAKTQKRPTSEIVREAVRRYLVAEELRTIRARLRPYAKAAGFVADEDFFKAIS